MARFVISDNTTTVEIFLPGQLFMFGGFMLSANSDGHLEQVDSYTPWSSN